MQVRDEEFQQSVIRPIAEDLAKTFMITIDRQLVVLGATKVVEGQDPREFWQQCHKDVTGVFLQALILKGRIEAAPDYYKFQWVESGESFDRQTMEDVYVSDGVADREVKWCVTPIVKTRKRRDHEWRLAIPAKVFATKKP